MNPTGPEQQLARPAESPQRSENLFFSQMWRNGGQAASNFLLAPTVSSFIGIGLALGRKQQDDDSSEDDVSQTEVDI